MSAIASEITDPAHAIEGAPRDLDPVLDVIGNAGVVLIGEATHGAHGFYRLGADFVGWLRDYNDTSAPATRVGFYGLDLLEPTSVWQRGELPETYPSAL